MPDEPAPQPDPAKGPPEPADPSPTGDAPEPDSDGKFPAEYVKTLRDEAAARRVEAKAATERGDAMASRLSDLTVAQAAAGILTDPADLTRYTEPADLVGDDGLPDPAKVRAAAEKLAADKPGLAARRVAGDAGQGPRGTSVPAETVDLAEILRGAVR